ncbi:hypothetical protein ACOMHN_003575 [Nucella lapillus]
MIIIPIRGVCLSHRGVWIFLGVVAVCSLLKMLYDLYYSFTQYKVQTDVMVTTTDLLPFPAVTICNLNGLEMSKLRAQDTPWLNVSAAIMAMSLLTLLFGNRVNNTMDILEKTLPPELLNQTFQDISTRAFADLNSTLISCFWDGEEQRCEDLFQPLDLELKRCFQFNARPHVERRLSHMSGMASGLHVLVNIRQEEYIYNEVVSAGAQKKIDEKRGYKDGREGEDKDGREGEDKDGREGEDKDGREGEDKDGREGEDKDGREGEDKDGREGEDKDGREGEDKDGREGEDKDGREGEDKDGREGEDKDGREGEDKDGREGEDKDGREGEDKDGREGEDKDGREGEDKDGREGEDKDGREGEDKDGREGEDKDGREGEDKDGREGEDKDGREGEDKDGMGGKGRTKMGGKGRTKMGGKGRTKMGGKGRTFYACERVVSIRNAKPDCDTAQCSTRLSLY